MSVVELLCSLGLILPIFHEPLAFLVPLAAICIAAELLLFCGLHIASGDKSFGPMVHWLAAATIRAFIAYGRFVLASL